MGTWDGKNKRKVGEVMYRCSFCGEKFGDYTKEEFNEYGEEELWGHIQKCHPTVFEDIQDWETATMLGECYEVVDEKVARLCGIIQEINADLRRLRQERDRYKTIAYSSINLGNLDYEYSKEDLLKELGCTEEEYNKIMEREE